jgi:hypothetical protein
VRFTAAVSNSAAFGPRGVAEDEAAAALAIGVHDRTLIRRRELVEYLCAQSLDVLDSETPEPAARKADRSHDPATAAPNVPHARATRVLHASAAYPKPRREVVRRLRSGSGLSGGMEAAGIEPAQGSLRAGRAGREQGAFTPAR